MNVAGLVEISEGSIDIQSDTTAFRVASLPGICVMKILAWYDRGIRDNRDGKDLGFILSNYIEMKYEDHYTVHEDLMEDENFDLVVTTARIMGRDIHDLLKSNPVALTRVKTILQKETEDEEYSKLAIALKDGGSFQYRIGYQCLYAMIQGIEDKENTSA